MAPRGGHGGGGFDFDIGTPSCSRFAFRSLAARVRIAFWALFLVVYAVLILVAFRKYQRSKNKIRALGQWWILALSIGCNLVYACPTLPCMPRHRGTHLMTAIAIQKPRPWGYFHVSLGMRNRALVDRSVRHRRTNMAIQRLPSPDGCDYNDPSHQTLPYTCRAGPQMGYSRACCVPGCAFDASHLLDVLIHRPYLRSHSRRLLLHPGFVRRESPYLDHD